MQFSTCGIVIVVKAIVVKASNVEASGILGFWIRVVGPAHRNFLSVVHPRDLFRKPKLALSTLEQHLQALICKLIADSDAEDAGEGSSLCLQHAAGGADVAGSQLHFE